MGGSSINTALNGDKWRAVVNKVMNFLYLHRALSKVTQSANQHTHTFNFFIY